MPDVTITLTEAEAGRLLDLLEAHEEHLYSFHTVPDELEEVGAIVAAVYAAIEALAP